MPRRVLEGKVVSDSSDKTITVMVERRVKDPLYQKVIRRSAKYAVHDENNNAKIGDWVSIEECRPISKRKSWRLLDGGQTQATETKKPAAKKATVKKTEAKKAEKKPVEKKTTAKKAPAKKAPAKKTAEKKPAAKKSDEK